VPTVLADVDRRGAADLLRLLRRYRLRQKVDIEDASQQYRVWAQYGGTADALHAAAAAPPPGWAPDPRLPHLGLRAVLPAAAASADGGGGAALASWQDHRRWRLLHGVAEGDDEIPTGEAGC
jgi:folate-binding Fe-S cluster repair protein YgfZ